MVRIVSLLAAALIGATVLGAARAPERHSCGTLETRLGLCASGASGTSATSDGKGVDLTTSMQSHDGGSAGKPGTPGSVGRPLTDEELLALFDEACYGNGQCDARGGALLNPQIPVDPAEPGTPGEPAAVVTIADVARFLPATATLHAEPDGWAVVGVPANFWAESAPITVSGELLGETAEVRFLPEAYRFAYGDGTTRATTSPGASWAVLGQQELTATSTSHVFTARGDVRASVTVVYSAQYRFANGAWTPVAGAVSAATPPRRVLVVVERTALTTPA